MILYEYPLNEGVRTMLRLEHLFDRLGQLLPRDTPVDHHFALVTIFEIIEVAARSDLKSDLLRDLDRQRSLLDSYRSNPQVSSAALEIVIRRIEQAQTALTAMPGKAGAALAGNEWLMSVKSRAGIPGGTCEFDLPAYYAWQQLAPEQRRLDLTHWVDTLVPLAEALLLLLSLLRDAGVPHRVVAQGGQYQQSLPAGRTYQLLRLRIDESLGLVPEISGHRLMVSVRLMRQDGEGRLKPAGTDAAFELTLCT